MHYRHSGQARPSWAEEPRRNRDAEGSFGRHEGNRPQTARLWEELDDELYDLDEVGDEYDDDDEYDMEDDEEYDLDR